MADRSFCDSFRIGIFVIGLLECQLSDHKEVIAASGSVIPLGTDLKASRRLCAESRPVDRNHSPSACGQDLWDSGVANACA
jgi:hypothetical protein